jgi:hypothetical protein
VGWSVEYGSVVAAAVLTQCGRIQKALRRKKGRERPRVTFRAAGRTKRGGRSRPFDALARVPVLQSWLRINLYGRGLQNRGRKTDQKTVRKTEFSTVFRYFNLFSRPMRSCPARIWKRRSSPSSIKWLAFFGSRARLPSATI